MRLEARLNKLEQAAATFEPITYIINWGKKDNIKAWSANGQSVSILPGETPEEHKARAQKILFDRPGRFNAMIAEAGT